MIEKVCPERTYHTEIKCKAKRAKKLCLLSYTVLVSVAVLDHRTEGWRTSPSLVYFLDFIERRV